MNTAAAAKRLAGVTLVIVPAALVVFVLSASGRAAPPPEDEIACERVALATEALEQRDYERMMEFLQRAHEAASTEHLHERTKMVLKVFNVSGEIYEQGFNDAGRHCGL